ncbi:UNVERIFIED_CONTAM: Mitochondrial import inner membrane translocase subunit Tim10 [Gekko kuhli]
MAEILRTLKVISWDLGHLQSHGDIGCRMTNACHRKCVPPHYKEAELSKGESVCLDRCVAKYLDIHERMGKKLTELSMQDEELMKRMQQGAGPA